MKSVTLGVTGHMLITAPFFLLSCFFYREPTAERAAEIDRFFGNIDTEVVVEESPSSIEMDNRQREMLGKMLVLAGLFLLLLVLVPNPPWGRMLFVLVALAVGGVGGLLLRVAKLAERKIPV